MTAIYLVFTILSLFTCMLPAGVLSVIWEPLSDNLTVGVPYIAILRVLITAGSAAPAALSVIAAADARAAMALVIFFIIISLSTGLIFLYAC